MMKRDIYKLLNDKLLNPLKNKKITIHQKNVIMILIYLIVDLWALLSLQIK